MRSESYASHEGWVACHLDRVIPDLVIDSGRQSSVKSPHSVPALENDTMPSGMEASHRKVGRLAQTLSMRNRNTWTKKSRKQSIFRTLQDQLRLEPRGPRGWLFKLFMLPFVVETDIGNIDLITTPAVTPASACRNWYQEPGICSGSHMSPGQDSFMWSPRPWILASPRPSRPPRTALGYLQRQRLASPLPSAAASRKAHR